MRKMKLPQIWIEEKDFKNRREFRIKIKNQGLKGTAKNHIYEKYLSRWITNHDSGGGHDEEYLFTAYKTSFGWNSYRRQQARAFRKCDKLIDKFLEDTEKPKITNHHR